MIQLLVRPVDVFCGSNSDSDLRLTFVYSIFVLQRCIGNYTDARQAELERYTGKFVTISFQFSIYILVLGMHAHGFWFHFHFGLKQDPAGENVQMPATIYLWNAQ